MESHSSQLKLKEVDTQLYNLYTYYYINIRKYNTVIQDKQGQQLKLWYISNHSDEIDPIIHQLEETIKWVLFSHTHWEKDTTTC